MVNDDGMSDEERGRALGAGLHRLAGGLSPQPDLFERVLARHTRRRQATLAGASLALSAVAGVTIPLSLGSGSTTAPPELSLTSFTLSLPSSYHLVDAAEATCHVSMGTIYIIQVTANGAIVAIDPPSYPNQPAIASAARAGGGCIAMELSGPGFPTSGSLPSSGLANIQPVQIGSYHGTIGTFTNYGPDSKANGTHPSIGATELVVNLALPAKAGLFRDLEIASQGLSRHQLVSIISSGLSPTHLSGSTTAADTGPS